MGKELVEIGSLTTSLSPSAGKFIEMARKHNSKRFLCGVIGKKTRTSKGDRVRKRKGFSA